MTTSQRVAVAAILSTAAVTYAASQETTATTQGATPTVVYASQSGRSTLDQGEGGGNPFASALIALLERPSLTLAELVPDLVALTKDKSSGFQVPDSPTARDETQWRLKPVPPGEKRVALVFVYSDYRDAGIPSLPGAERDRERVTQALRNAGFELQSAGNPTKQDLRALLERLSSRSSDAVAAVIYLTGHGFEHGGRVYLLPSDYPFNEGPGRLPELAIDVANLTTHLKATSANLVFFGGCRTFW